MSEPNPYSLLVGRIAFNVFREDHLSDLTDPSKPGGTHSLPDFEVEEILGFAQALLDDATLADRCEIRLPESLFASYGLPTSFLTSEGAVEVRNQDADNKIVIVPVIKSVSEASFNHTDPTDTKSICSAAAIEKHWIPQILQFIGGGGLTENTEKTLKALAKGLVALSNCSIAVAVEYLVATAQRIPAEGSVGLAAGQSLRILELPLYKECFASIRADRLNLAKSWGDALKKHDQTSCYLRRRDPKSQALDPVFLREQLASLEDDTDHTNDPDLISAFKSYIESQHGESKQAEHLLFNFDWSVVRHCFEKRKEAVSSSFQIRTRNALVGAGHKLTDNDEEVLKNISKAKSRSEAAMDDAKDFFEAHSDAINEDPKLFSEWQKLIHGSKLAGTNLLALIIESFRLADLDSAGSSYRVALQGLRQGGKSKKLNSLKKYNPAACLYFARAYAGLNQLTGGLVEFRHSAVVDYEAPDIQDYLRLNAPKKSSSKVANTVEFDLIIEELKDGSVNAVEQRPIAWTFDPDSILSEQVGDLDRLVRLIQETPKTALVVCRGNYERVGPKGSPPGLSLSNTAGLSNEHGAGGKGSFVPSKQRARERENSLLKAWNEVLADARSENVDAERIALIEALGAKLKSSYESIIPKLAVDFLNQEGVGEMVSDYGALLSALANFRPEKFRNQLLRIILSIGNAEIARNGRRPAVCVVCPWHPLRIEAMAARAAQFRDILRQLCSSDRPSFSDERGELFFKECASIFEQPAFPEISSIREDTQLRIRAVTEGLEGYSLHLPVEAEAIGYECSPESTKHSALLVTDQIQEYIRLQPHERDNLSLVLYDCSSPALPGEIVAALEKHNQDNPEREITCQIFLMHREKAILRDMYQQLVTNRIGAHGDVPTEATGDLLSRIRVNVTAANSLEVTDRGEPVDIVYCKDVITRIVSHKGGLNWRKRLRRNCEAVELFPYRWSRRLPVEDGARRTWSLLSCPAMTGAGWAHLNSISSFFVPDHQDAWENGHCMMPVNMLNFEDADIKKVFDETHKLGTWVINEDELLERKLLENNEVKVIRYIQAAIHGRNLIISSTSKETLLLNTLRGKLQQILPGTPDSGRLSALAKRFIEDANQISGGLFLKSARRTNNTGELMGMVLSRFLVKKELGSKPTAWCFLDDYAQWLGKREETQMADLLVLSWDATGSTPVLDIVVTEAKFVNADSASSKAKESAIQLRHSLSQLEAALVAPKATVDQEVWLARLSNLFLSRVTFTGGPGDSDPSAWANLILERKCQVRIRGYSHVFVHSPDDVAIPDSIKVPKTINGIQEIFSPSAVRSLVLIYEGAGETPEDQIQTSLKQVRSIFLLDAIQTNPQAITQPQNGSTNVCEVIPINSECPPEILAPNLQTVSSGANAEVEGAGNQIPTVPVDFKIVEHPSPSPGIGTEHSSGIMEYLSQRAVQLAGSKDEGQKWLVEVEKQLRSAFINRQLPYNPVDGFEPILTPNAGIFRLKGKDNLTVSVIEAKATEIFTTEGLKILSVEPEPGRLRITISRPHRETLYTEAVLHSFLLNHAAAAAKECLIVGIKEEDGQPLLLDPFAQPHSLIAGSTGSGKSILMQNIILSIAATRSPDESRIFLIDPKYGVDYMALQGLPHISAGSGGVIDSQEEALECLEAAVLEMERRLRLMKEASIKAGVGIPNILAYRQVTGEPMPTWWMIHDEFADWMQTEEYRAAIPALVNRLGVKARAAGIFLIFGAQRPDNSVFPLQLRSQLLNRLVLQVDGPGTSEIALGEKGKKAERLLGKGHMLAKVAGHPDPVFAQVPFIDPSTAMPVLVSKIIAHHKNGGCAFSLE